MWEMGEERGMMRRTLWGNDCPRDPPPQLPVKFSASAGLVAPSRSCDSHTKCVLSSVCSLQSNSISDTGVAALMGALCANRTLLSLK